MLPCEAAPPPPPDEAGLLLAAGLEGAALGAGADFCVLAAKAAYPIKLKVHSATAAIIRLSLFLSGFIQFSICPHLRGMFAVDSMHYWTSDTLPPTNVTFISG